MENVKVAINDLRKQLGYRASNAYQLGSVGLAWQSGAFVGGFPLPPDPEPLPGLDPEPEPPELPPDFGG